MQISLMSVDDKTDKTCARRTTTSQPGLPRLTRARMFLLLFASIYHIYTSYIRFTTLSPSLVFSPSVLLSQFITVAVVLVVVVVVAWPLFLFLSFSHSLFLFQACFSIYLFRSVSLSHWCGIHFLQGRSRQ